MSKLITTVIPTFRRPQLLKKAIASVVDQTYPHLQICVYDNASGDETEEIVRQWMKVDARIKYHCHPFNIGMMANYEYAFSQINTPYFSLLSDDDVLLPWFYETALKDFEDYPEIAFCACGVRAIDEDGNFVSDPLSIWKRNGFYAALEGLYEMITKPVLPIGILFQQKFVKDIRPDLSQEIQMRWDTDYLLQINQRYPFFVNQRICAIFLAHANGFSSRCYREMLVSAKKFEHHIIATDRIMYRILTNPSLSAKMKRIIEKKIHRSIKRGFYGYLSHYYMHDSRSEFLCASRMYIKRYGYFNFFTGWLNVFAKWLYLYCKSILVFLNKSMRFKEIKLFFLQKFLR